MKLCTVRKNLGGAPRAQSQMDAFKDIISFYDLHDMQYTGHPFTWSNGRERINNIQCRLDKFFINTQGVQTWQIIKVSHLHSSISNHLPIFLETKQAGQQDEDKRERPFRFEKMWCKEDNFSEIISYAWERMGNKESINEVAEAIDKLGKEPKGWNKQVFGNVNVQLKEATKKMERLAVQNPTAENLAQLNNQKKLVNDLLQRQEIMWRQRSRVEWLKEGDHNTKIFHGRATMRRNKNRIFRLKNSEGEWISNREELENLARIYFMDLFSTSHPNRINEAIEAVNNRIEHEAAAFLDLPFTSMEVKEALFQMGLLSPQDQTVCCHYFTKILACGR